MEKLFIETTKYVIDEDVFYKKIVNLDYSEYMNFKRDFLTQAVYKNMVVDNNGAKDVFWSRLLKKIKDKYNYLPPLSMSEDAIRRRYERGS